MNEHNHTQSQSLDKAYSENHLDSKDDIFKDGLDKTESEEGVTFKADSSAQDSQLFTSLFKWKSAEQQVLNALNQNGYELEDVSVQNLGYDLEGRDPNGGKIYIEVKSISSVGQNFRMTNNEYAVAQVKGNAYVVAVTYLKNNELYIGMYRNPIQTLHLDRQCVQWVWLCSEYSYKPKSYKI